MCIYHSYILYIYIFIYIYPWRRKWQPTPVLLPGTFHGLRSLVGCSPWGHKESDMTEQLCFASIHIYIYIYKAYIYIKPIYI